MEKASIIPFEAMPKCQEIEGRHGKGQPGTEVVPHPVHHPLKMADQGEHGEDRFHLHAFIPLAPLTDFEVGRVSPFGMKAVITEDHHLALKLPDQRLKVGVVDVGGGAIPPCHQPPPIEYQTQLASHYPAVVGLPFSSNLTGTPAFPCRVEQLYSIAVDDTQQSRGGQEGVRPVLMGRQEPEQTRTVGHAREHALVVVGKPTIEGPVAHPFDGMEQSYGDHLTGPQQGLRVLGYRLHLVIYSAKKLRDKILCGHVVSLRCLFTHQQLGDGHVAFQSFWTTPLDHFLN